MDIGVGAGTFITKRPLTWGYDINSAAVAWLERRQLFWNPYIEPCNAVTMWDLLEHIERFPDLLANVSQYVFVSLPVFRDQIDVYGSKHMRLDEHYWYFSPEGLIAVMDDLGWNCLEENWRETLIGRESIASFAFRRVR